MGSRFFAPHGWIGKHQEHDRRLWKVEGVQDSKVYFSDGDTPLVLAESVVATHKWLKDDEAHIRRAEIRKEDAFAHYLAEKDAAIAEFDAMEKRTYAEHQKLHGKKRVVLPMEKQDMLAAARAKRSERIAKAYVAYDQCR